MTTIAPKISILDSTIEELTARLTQALNRADRLEKQMTRIARGTLPPPVADAPAPAIDSLKKRMSDDTKRPSADAVRRALYLKPCDTATLAGRLELPVAATLNMLRTLQREGKVVNMGSISKPVWVWVIGDDASTKDLKATVRQLIALRPTSLQELMAATRCRIGRVSGVIVQFQRRGAPIENRGTGRKALWFLPNGAESKN